MRALTLYPEHAEMFRRGLRTVETRSKRTHYRGPVMLHAGARDPDCAAARRSPRSQAALDAIPHGDPLPTRCIVAVADLVGCVRTGEPDLGGEIVFYGNTRYLTGESWVEVDDVGVDECPYVEVDASEAPFGDFTPGRYAWLLDNIRPLDVPVAVERGWLGLWHPPEWLVGLVALEVEE